MYQELLVIIIIRRQNQTLCTHKLYMTVINLFNRKSEACTFYARSFVFIRQSAEHRENQSADGIIIALRQRYRQHFLNLFNIAGAVNRVGRIVNLCDILVLLVIFVLNIAEYRLDLILERDKSRSSAVFVNNNRHLYMLVGHFLEQLAAAL